MRLSRKSRAEKSFRELPVGARQKRNIRFEVHSASSVLKFCSRYNGCDRYIAKTFKPIEVPVARPVRKQSGIADLVYSSLHFKKCRDFFIQFEFSRMGLK